MSLTRGRESVLQGLNSRTHNSCPQFNQLCLLSRTILLYRKEVVSEYSNENCVRITLIFS